jgi:hypothetical protein
MNREGEGCLLSCETNRRGCFVRLICEVLDIVTVQYHRGKS